MSDQEALLQAANQLDGVLGSEYADSYGGILFQPEHARLVVLRKPDASLDARVRDIDLGVNVVLENSPYSRQELQALVSQILQDEQGTWTPAGISISGASPRPDASGVDSFVQTDDLPAAQRLFDERYGAGVVQLSEGGPAYPAAPDATPVSSGLEQGGSR